MALRQRSTQKPGFLPNRPSLLRASNRRRRGAVLVLGSLLIVVAVFIVAMAVDVGYLLNVRSELQRAADASALAAIWEFSENLSASPGNVDAAITEARLAAQQYTSLNRVCRQPPSVDINSGNSLTGDVVIGYLNDPANPNAVLDTSDPSRFNAVQVRVRRSTEMNGEVPMFFGRAFGVDSRPLDAVATAMISRNISGFRSPSSGTLDILPFALDLESWNQVANGIGSDSFEWDENSESVDPSSDGVAEVNLYPQDTGSPGNRGTVDIGAANNSTNDIARQIVHGISSADLDHIGGSIQFDGNGELHLNADPGISNGFKDELASIVGEKRMIPIFSDLQGNGNNAQYTIVKFVGVRIMYVRLTGNPKQVIVQPATVLTRYTIPGDGQHQLSDYIVSPAVLTH